MSADASAAVSAGRHRMFLFAGASFDEASHALHVAGVARPLEPKPRALLLLLLSQPREVVSKTTILATLWPAKQFVGEGSLATAVYALRAALHPDGHTIIQSVTGMGYKIAVPVEIRVIDTAPDPPIALRPGGHMPGRGQWLLERPLGPASSGGAPAHVWLARHDKTAELRVFKFADTPQRLDSLKREAALSRLLRSKLGQRDDMILIADTHFEERPFYTESPYGGPDLPSWLASLGGVATLELPLRLELVAGIARIVAVAHDAGVLHSDIKPTNILIAVAADGTARPQLADFGASRLTEAARMETISLTLQNLATVPAAEQVGSFLYMAPELFRGGVHTATADVYALAILLYQMVVADLDRPLSAGWERDVEDELLRQDIADAAAGDPALRLGSAQTLAGRLETLEARRAEARAMAAQQQQQRLRDAEHAELSRIAAASRIEAAATAERARLAHQLAARTRVAALILCGLLCWAVMLAFYAWRERRIALDQRDRAEQITAIAQNAVSGLIDDIAQGISERSVLTNADLQKLLDRAAATIARMRNLAPSSLSLRRLEARALLKFADTRLHQGDLPGALAAALRARDLLRKLNAATPDDIGIALDYAESERWMGDIRKKQQDLPAAMAEYSAEFAILDTASKALAAGDPRHWNMQLHLAGADGDVADVLLAQQHVDAAFARYKVAANIIASGVAAHGGNVDWQLASSDIYDKIGDTLEVRHDWRGALASYRAGLRIRQSLCRRDPTNMRWQRDLSVSYADIGDEQTKLQAFSDALTSYEAGLALDEARLSYDPSRAQWQSDVAISDDNVGATLMRMGAAAKALAYFQAGLSIVARVLDHDPADEQAGTLLIGLEIDTGEDLLRLHRPQEASAHAAKALAMARGAQARHPDSAEIAALVNNAEALENRAGIK